jgi:outer membrane autotransporter protein
LPARCCRRCSSTRTPTTSIQYALSFAPAGIGLNDNQTSLGGYLNNVIGADPTSLDAVTGALLAVTSNEGYSAALDQLSPEVYGDTAVSTLYGAHAFGNALLSCHPRDGAYVAVREDECVWADISGRDYQRDSTDAGIGYSEQTWSVSGGGQVKVAKDVVLGFAGGFEQGSGDTSSGASVDTDRAYGGVALKHTSGPWLLAAAVYGGKGWSDTSRSVNFGGLAMLAEGEQDIEHLSGRVRAAYQAGGNALYVKPMVDLEATQLWLGSVQETGGPAALSIADSNETIFSAAPAVEVGGEHAISGGLLVRPFARVGAIFYSNDDIAISSSFAGGPAGIPSFQTQAEIDRVMGTVGAGLDLVWSDASTLKLHYDGMFGEATEQHTFGAKASFKF